MRIKLIGFRHHGVRPNTKGLSEPTAEQMCRYHDAFATRGLFSLQVIYASETSSSQSLLK
jgi:hypothetical protein